MTSSADGLDIYTRWVASEDLQCEEAGSEGVVFNPRTQEYHLLNSTAHSILNACNGVNTIRDIVIMLRLKFATDAPQVISDDVTETIGALKEKRLIRQIVELPGPTEGATDPADPDALIELEIPDASLFPFLLPGDVALLTRCGLNDPDVGDIAVGECADGKMVVRRVLVKSGLSELNSATTTVDSQEPHSPAEMERVIGKVVAVTRERGIQWLSHANTSSPSPSNCDSTDASDLPFQQRRSSLDQVRVLDLRQIPPLGIRSIASVTNAGTVLLSEDNACEWAKVHVKNAKAVLTVPDNYRVYTGQPELLPELCEFLKEPMRLAVVGQLFLTACKPHDIPKLMKDLVLVGQAYVTSDEAKAALASVTRVLRGDIRVVPQGHSRWIGQSLLGPEYVQINNNLPLIAVGELNTSTRLDPSVHETLVLS
jgi:hypothetical protein